MARLAVLSAGSAAALLVAGAVAAPAGGPKCFALALSGGGDRGSFEAGAIQGLVSRLPDAERQWNIITGISAGSILASAGALYNLGEEEQMAEFMVNSTVDFTKSDVYRQWFPLGVLQGLFETGLFNTSPLHNTLLEKLSTRPVGNRKFTIATTDDVDGSLVTFDETMIGSDVARWATYVRASAAIPGLFESVKVDGHVFSDGGCVMGIDVFAAVNRCKEIVERDEDIIVDLITCDSEYLKPWSAWEDDASIQLYLRGMQQKSYNQQMADIFDACEAFPNVTWRYYIEPPESGLPSNGFSFDRGEMLEMAAIGRQVAGSAETGGACDFARKYKEKRRHRLQHRSRTAAAPAAPASPVVPLVV